MTRWKNTKTGKIYIYMAYGTDKTNIRDGLEIVVFHPESNPHKILTMEEREFFDRHESLGDVFPRVEMLSKGGR